LKIPEADESGAVNPGSIIKVGEGYIDTRHWHVTEHEEEYYCRQAHQQ
jgi:oxalate decarboxylase/phosphoglucose isomerase-like protein (cupin superfamily)